MFKPKTTISGRLENSSGVWIRTNGLRITGEARKAPIFIYGDIRALLRSRKELALYRAFLYNIEHEYY